MSSFWCERNCFALLQPARPQAYSTPKGVFLSTSSAEAFHLQSGGYNNRERLKSEQEQVVAAKVEKFYGKAKEIVSLNHEFLEKIAAALAEKHLLNVII